MISGKAPSHPVHLISQRLLETRISFRNFQHQIPSYKLAIQKREPHQKPNVRARCIQHSEKLQSLSTVERPALQMLLVKPGGSLGCFDVTARIVAGRGSRNPRTICHISAVRLKQSFRQLETFVFQVILGQRWVFMRCLYFIQQRLCVWVGTQGGHLFAMITDRRLMQIPQDRV